MNDADLEILVHMMNGARPPDFAVRLLEDICKRTGLDWKARHAYLQKRRNKNGADSWQAVLSIDGFRAVGTAHPDFAGQAGPEWTLKGPPDHIWYDNPPDGKPYSSRAGIIKRLPNNELVTTWGIAKYSDYYAGMMWDKFPSTMIAKCAEMLAWRKTFPRVFGGLYGDAELEQIRPPVKETVIGVLGEAEVPHEKSAAAAWKEKLDAAQTMDEVLAIGKLIQKDKTISSEETIDLHQHYTKVKAAAVKVD